MEEIWREVPRYNGAYLISNLGNIIIILYGDI